MPKILIVEDDQSIRELYKYIFVDLGYEVETAIDGRDGLAKVPVFEPDCMLVDISMPEMTGVEFTESLRKADDPKLKNIPFVVLTGESPTFVPLQYAFRGNTACKAFLPKLTGSDVVAKTVQEILDRNPGW